MASGGVDIFGKPPWQGLPGDDRLTLDGRSYISISAACRMMEVGAEKRRQELAAIVADRDAWKQAHEDLLEVRRQDLAAMQARIGSLTQDA